MRCRQVLATLVAATAIAACGGDRPPPAGGPPASAGRPGDTPPAIVLVSIDTLRSDRLPAYGYAGVETPAIDAFAADAVRFARAYAPAPLTLPSHASLFSGQSPPEHGVRYNASYRVSGATPVFLTELLREAGYVTGGAVSSFVLRSGTGMNRGFDFYDDAVDREETGDLWGPERRGTDTWEAARGWLRRVAERGERFFLFVHLYEPHQPYTPPPAFAERWGESYEAEIAAADAVVGEVMAELERLGVYEDGLVVLLSDHGEGLGDHQEDTHGILLYRETLQVPLLVKWPGGAGAGSVVDSPVGLVDLLPTIAEAIAREPPPGLAGRPLPRTAGAEAPPGERTIYAETIYPYLYFGWSDLASLVSGRYHLIDGPDPELYDLVADPAERRNLVGRERRVYHRMAEEIRALRAPVTPPEPEDPEVAARLAALGYVAAATPARAHGSRADPKVEMVRLAELRSAANAAFGEDRHADAVPLLERLVADSPAMTDAWEKLGLSLERLGRPGEALAAFERTAELTGGAPRPSFEVARTLVALRRLEEAAAHLPLVRGGSDTWADELELEIALARGDLGAAVAVLGRERPVSEPLSRDVRRRLGLELAARGRPVEAVDLLTPLVAERPEPPAMNALAMALLGAGRRAEAEAMLRRVLAADAANATAHEHLGLLALEAGRPAAARDHLERALAADDGRANAWNLLGVVALQTGRPAAALDAWRRAVDLDPRQLDALYNLGMTAARLGEVAVARDALERYVATAPPSAAADVAKARTALRSLGA